MWKKIKSKFKYWIKTVRVPFLPLIISFLGAYGGSSAGDKNWRRLGVPILLTAYAYWRIQDWWVLTILLLYPVLTIGHGTPAPSWPDNPNKDSGSTMGRWFYLKFDRNKKLADKFTRGVIGFLMVLTWLSIPIITSEWLYFVLGGVAVMLSQVFVSHKALGAIKVPLFGKKVELNHSDLITWTVIGLSFYGIVRFSV